MRMAFLAGALALLCQCAHVAPAPSVRETFDDGAIDPAFEPCNRPENEIAIVPKEPGSRDMVLRLRITPGPLFPDAGRTVGYRALNPQRCLMPGEEHRYWNDDAERAELWENRSTSPMFGDAHFYGFSMRMGPGTAPDGDFNRLVAGQWKAEGDDSPFLAQRLTGGFYHITLDLDAVATAGGVENPTTCKVLLAYTNQAPPMSDTPLALERDPRCETRLQFPGNSVRIKDPPTIRRLAYLPIPAREEWVHLVFQVKGGANGVVRVWANHILIAEATGTIGHASGIGKRQYFKFGPYRDVASNEAAFYLDNLARGRSYDEVDPSLP
jgi:hypothetical protein